VATAIPRERNLPTCRGVLFAQPEEEEYEYEEEEPALSPAQELERHLQRLQYSHKKRQDWLRGYPLRVLRVSDPNGFLARLWSELRDAFAPDECETVPQGWSRRICDLIENLLQGLGLPDHNRDRLNMVFQAEINGSIVIFNPDSPQPPGSGVISSGSELRITLESQLVVPEGYRHLRHLRFERLRYLPVEQLSRNILRTIRFFPSGTQPDPIFWRALIRFQALTGSVRASTLQDCDTQLAHGVPPGSSIKTSDAVSWRLYMLLVLMAQDEKFNLRPKDVYDAEDVARLLRTVSAPHRTQRQGGSRPGNRLRLLRNCCSLPSYCTAQQSSD
jgi:hypothetical protein